MLTGEALPETQPYLQWGLDPYNCVAPRGGFSTPLSDGAIPTQDGSRDQASVVRGYFNSRDVLQIDF